LYADVLVSTLAECVAADPGDEVLHACAISSVHARQRDLLVEVLDRGLEKPGWSLLGRRLVIAMVGSRSPEDRVWLFEHVAASANDDESRAALLLASIERQLQPTSKKPGVVHLPREPKGWAALSSRRDTLGVRANQLMDCMDWPEKPSPVAAKQPRPLDTRERALFERGERVYSLCYSCHGPDGLGTASQAPPLAGSALAQASDGVAIRIVLHGLEASTVGSTPYPVMPPVPINDESIAAVLTYVRRAWSNVADPILPERVREIREHTKSHNRPWTRAELEAIK